MKTNDFYAKAAVWDTLHARDKELNPQGWWVPGLLPFLTAAGARTVLDVGCGTGADAVNLAEIGLHVTAMDYSEVALARARDKAAEASVAVDFRQGDMAQPFPFADENFDAVMSNVAMHMFDDQTTRRIIGEMRRVLKPAGLLLLHVNSTEDMSYREKQLGILRVQPWPPTSTWRTMGRRCTSSANSTAVISWLTGLWWISPICISVMRRARLLNVSGDASRRRKKRVNSSSRPPDQRPRLGSVPFCEWLSGPPTRSGCQLW